MSRKKELIDCCIDCSYWVWLIICPCLIGYLVFSVVTTNRANEHCARVGKNETICEKYDCVAYYKNRQHRCEADDKTYFLIWGGGFLVFAVLACGLTVFGSMCIACYFRWEQGRKRLEVAAVSVEEEKIQRESSPLLLTG